MAKAKSIISPFPADIDRRDFGNWLSGFTDGEGCFRLARSRHPKHPEIYRSGFATFEINMRLDDRPILDQIQSFFGFGSITEHESYSEDRDAEDQAKLVCTRVRPLKGIIIPHFEQFPLRAKKARDFQIWREAVQLLYQVAMRPRKAKRGKGGGAGRIASWTPDELARFTEFCLALGDVREFNAPPPVLTTPPRPSDSQGLLFES
jgi:hypothetical protein